MTDFLGYHKVASRNLGLVCDFNLSVGFKRLIFDAFDGECYCGRREAGDKEECGQEDALQGCRALRYELLPNDMHD